MAKWRNRKKTVPAGAPMDTEASQDKIRQDKAPEKGGGGAGEPPAAEVVLSVPVHCDGCARKLRRSVQRLQGVDEVIVDCWTNTVVVRGPKATENTAMVVETVERRTGKKAVVVSQQSPAKLPPSSPAKGVEVNKDDGAEGTKKEIIQEDMYQEMVIVMRIDLHCDACSLEIKRRILKIKGVEEAAPHLKSSQLTVTGTVEPATLVGFIHKCTGRKAAILRAEPSATEEQQRTPGNQVAHENKGEDREELQEKKVAGEREDDNVEEKGHHGDGVEESEEVAEAKVDEQDARSGVVEQKKNHVTGNLFKFPVADPIVAVEQGDQSENMLTMNGFNQHYYHYHPVYPNYEYSYASPYQQPNLGPYAAYNLAIYGYPQYPPQTFSDENPNACTVM